MFDFRSLALVLVGVGIGMLCLPSCHAGIYLSLFVDLSLSLSLCVFASHIVSSLNTLCLCLGGPGVCFAVCFLLLWYVMSCLTTVDYR